MEIVAKGRNFLLRGQLLFHNFEKFLDDFAKLIKATTCFVRSVLRSLCLSPWSNSATTGRILIKFDMRGVSEHNEELSDLYSLPNIVRVVKSRRMRWAGHVARMAEERGVHRVLVGKPEAKRPLGRRRSRWEDNIKMDLQEV